MSRLTVPLCELGGDDLAVAGGKGAQLGALLARGLPVPPGFCVSTEAFRRGMDDAVREAITSAYTAMGGGRVAVRSSATAEDLPDASFAGQQDTFLNIEGGEAVVSAVADCWKSLFTERAVAYRRDRGMDDGAVAMAVVIQRMVDADAAGVLFTINPVSGAIDELVAEAATGLGDKVVSAQVTPDRYRLRRRAPHDILQQEGTQTSRLLTPALLSELAELGLSAERMLGHAADLEWAVAAGRVHLLQARAVTAAGPRLPVVRYGSRWNAEQARSHLIFWGNYNIRDTMPYPHTPFSWSFWNYLLWPAAACAIGLLTPEDARNPEDAPAILDLVDGRLHWNMNVCSAFLGTRPRWLTLHLAHLLDAELPAVLEGVLDRGELAPLSRPFSLRRTWFTLRHAPAGLGIILGRKSAAEVWDDLRACQREVEQFAQMDTSLLSEEQILAIARYFASENLPRTVTALAASLPSLPCFALLQWLLPRWGLGEHLPHLVSGVRDNPTMETALAIWDLAEKAGPEVRAMFARVDIAGLPAALAETAAGRDFLAAMQRFLQAHGHRAVREYDLSCPRWRDDPTFVYETVRNYFSHPAGQPTPREHYRRQVEAHEQAKRTVEDALRRHPLRRRLFRKLMRVLEARMPLREAYKFYTLLGVAHVRDLLLEVGRRQVARGVLQASDDYLFLSIPEIEKLARGELEEGSLREQIAIRRREFALHMRALPPLVVRSDGKPVMKPIAAGEVLRGAGASAGVARGPARVLFDPADGALLRAGDILVAKFTDPGWTPLFLTAGALVMEIGGIVSHGAVVAREYGIPAVVGVSGATRILRDGEMLEVDGANGEVRRLGAANAAAV
jgi:phosphohistidine swiveling domain-containing protein